MDQRLRSGSQRQPGQWNDAISVLLMTNLHANCTNQSQQLEKEHYSNVKSPYHQKKVIVFVFSYQPPHSFVEQSPLAII